MKVLINVYVPAIMQEFDVLIPDSLRISDATKLIVEAVLEKTNYEYQSSRQELLCLKRSNIVLDDSLCICQYGIGNGDTLVVV